MVIWRISNHADLSGAGGLRSSGRWHRRGAPVVYLAEHPALAMLEVLVHFELVLGEVPDGYMLLEVGFPDDGSIHVLEDSDLPDGWREHRALTQGIGDDWLASGASALLGVPSAVMPKSRNYLLNPRHPDAAVAVIESVGRVPFDRRLFR